MKCVEVKEHLETFLDNEISGVLSIEIARHLDICDECRLEFAEINSVSKLLRKELPASPSNQLDVKVLAAFRQHHEKKSAWDWSGVFAFFANPKPVFALLALCLLTWLAFSLGRLSAPTKEVLVSTPPQIVEKEVPVEKIKYVEVPTTKIIEIPIEKERIVTRTVYRKTETRPKLISPTLRAGNPSREIPESVQQVDLKDFQPLGEITPKILKKGEMDEK